MTIRISKEDNEKLKHLAKEYYVVKGARSLALTKALHYLITKEFEEAYPREYQTTGFDRQ